MRPAALVLGLALAACHQADAPNKSAPDRAAEHAAIAKADADVRAAEAQAQSVPAPGPVASPARAR